MNSYFKIIDDVKTALIAEPFINNVSTGDIYDVDLKKIIKLNVKNIKQLGSVGCNKQYDECCSSFTSSFKKVKHIPGNIRTHKLIQLFSF